MTTAIISARAVRSHGSWNTGSSRSTTTGPRPCTPPRSCTPSTAAGSTPPSAMMTAVARWPQFRAEEPDLAAAAEGLLYQFGVGLGFLATVRLDGGPRVHPVCPVLDGDGLWCFVVP